MIPVYGPGFIQFVIACMASATFHMIIYGVYTGDLEIYNYIAFLNILIGRQVVISGKYGFYKGNHLKIFSEVRMT